MATATAKAAQRLHFNLPPLPYPQDALEPVISAETLGLHHGKHHKKYVDTMNELLATSGQFGSGWAWLVDKDGKLQVVATANADTPLAHGVRCLLTLDVWEHAYYIDYRNQRERYVQAVLEKRLNWEFAEKNLG